MKIGWGLWTVCMFVDYYLNKSKCDILHYFVCSCSCIWSCGVCDKYNILLKVCILQVLFLEFFWLSIFLEIYTLLSLSLWTKYSYGTETIWISSHESLLIKNDQYHTSFKILLNVTSIVRVPSILSTDLNTSAFPTCSM